ncbi:MAG: hypothetical protein JNJ54_10990 [Myxococcaceae bacterium]|nr:hypothetical protein [Myxococcaceae bacterium]
MSGSSGPTGPMGSSVSADVEAAGANCANGGVRLTSSAGTSYVCNGQPGMAGQVMVAVEAPGANCSSGGARITAGGTSTFACNGAPGDAGVSVEASSEAPGTNCAAGGTKLVTASGSSFVCNGDSSTVFARTRVVRAVGTPADNGTALRNAISGLAPAPAVRAGWQVLLEPGQYDLGATTLSLANIALSGAGEGSTFISGAPAGAVIEFTGDGSLSGVTVTRQSSAARGVVVRANVVGSNVVTIREATLTAAAGTNTLGVVTSYVEQIDGSLTIKDTFIGGQQRGPGLVTGVFRPGLGSTSLRDVDVFITGSVATGADVAGLVLRGGTNTFSVLDRVAVTLAVQASHTAPVGIEATGPITASRVSVIASGTAGAGTLTGVRLASLAGEDPRFLFDDLRVDLSGALPETSTRRALQATGPLGTLELRQPFFLGATGSASLQSSLRRNFITHGLVSQVFATLNTSTCIGVTTPTGAAVTCP